MAAKTMTRQSQKGGDGSNNFQSEKMVVNVGIDEKRAREVFREMNLQLRKEYTQEALAIANARISEFEDSLVSKMEQVDGALEAFSDPSFQLLLVEAQKSAASTERPADYDLLSELLIHRFHRGSSRSTRAGVSLAVEIVDKVSDEALLGLTAVHAAIQFVPTSGCIRQGLNVLNDLHGKIIYGELPSGQEWLDHLDILKAVRISPLGSLKKAREYFPHALSGYVDVGIEKNSANQSKALELLDSNSLPRSFLVDHDLNSNFQRIPVSHRAQIKNLFLRHIVPHQGSEISISSKLTEGQIATLDSIYELYTVDSNLKQKNISLFMIEWENRPNLKILGEWWDGIPMGLTITSVGKVLAHSNAQRCNKNLPSLD